MIIGVGVFLLLAGGFNGRFARNVWPPAGATHLSSSAALSAAGLYLLPNQLVAIQFEPQLFPTVKVWVKGAPEKCSSITLPIEKTTGDITVVKIGSDAIGFFDARNNFTHILRYPIGGPLFVEGGPGQPRG